MKNESTGKTFSWKKICLIVFAFVAILSLKNIPIYAASDTEVTVKTQSELYKALKDSKVTTITIKSNMKCSFIVKEVAGTENKELIISAPKAKIENRLRFKSVTILEAGSFYENTDGKNGNTILLKGKNTEITISAFTKTDKVIVEDKKANIVIQEKGKVNSLICKKKASKVVLTMEDESVASVNFSKKTNLTIKGENSAKVSISCKAKGSSVISYVPIDLMAYKNMVLTLEKGSENSVISRSKKTVKIKVIEKIDKKTITRTIGDDADSNSLSYDSENYSVREKTNAYKTIFESDNKSHNDYFGDWASPVDSYLYKENGYFWRVECDYLYFGKTGKVFIEQYDLNWNYVDSRILDYDSGLIWGGFYYGSKYNFIILGQENTQEDDNRMVIRVIKYDKNWNELGSVDLNGANTVVPFLGGSLRCTEKDGFLYIFTCHKRYTTIDDGLNHQSNMLFSVDEENMIIPDADYYFQPGFCSHSFNQYILLDEYGQLVTIDHGDAFPRAVQMCILNAENGEVSLVNSVNLIMLKGECGDNTTGAGVGGIEETSEGYVVSYNYDKLGGNGGTRVRSIFIEYLSKGLAIFRPICSGTCIEYDPEGNKETSVPIMVSVGKDKGGYVFWEEYEYDENRRNYNTKVCYVKYDVRGSVSNVFSFEGNLSDCKPIYEDGFIYWYVTGEKILNEYNRYYDKKTWPCFYSLNIETGEIWKTPVENKSVPVQVIPNEMDKTPFLNNIGGQFDIINGKDVLDAKGKVIETEYYDEESELYSKMVYSYDENGNVIEKTYTTDRSEPECIRFEYYPGGENLKILTETYNDIYYHESYILTLYENGRVYSEKTVYNDYDERGINDYSIVETKWLENGMPYEKTNEYSDFIIGRVIYEVESFYENGKKKQLIRETTTNNAYENRTGKQYINYSEEGKITSEIFEDEKGVYLEYYYDEKGRIIESNNYLDLR